MPKVKITISDVQSGHVLKTMVREWSEDNTALDAAEEIRDAIDTMTEGEDAGVADS